MAICWNFETSNVPSRKEFSLPISPSGSLARKILPVSMIFAKSSRFSGCETMWRTGFGARNVSQPRQNRADGLVAGKLWKPLPPVIHDFRIVHGCEKLVPEVRFHEKAAQVGQRAAPAAFQKGQDGILQHAVHLITPGGRKRWNTETRSEASRFFSRSEWAERTLKPME